MFIEGFESTWNSILGGSRSLICKPRFRLSFRAKPKYFAMHTSVQKKANCSTVHFFVKQVEKLGHLIPFVLERCIYDS